MQANYHNIAVLIDAENISSRYFSAIFEKVALFGEISVRRIYGDWTADGMKIWKAILQENAIQPVQQFSNTSGKNSTDSALIIDAMDLLYKDYFDCFCLVSSDSDFTRLAQRIREQGKYVIGIGELKTPQAFVKGCNEFIYLDSKKSEKEDGAGGKAKEKKSNDEIIERAIEELADASGWVHLSKIMQYIRQVQPDFDIKTLGFKKAIDYFSKKKDKYNIRPENESGPGIVYISLKGK